MFDELERSADFKNSRLHTTPRTHHGYTFTTPLIVTETNTGFPIDLICDDMVTQFPDNHPILPGIEYRFPTDNGKVYELARTLHLPDIGEVTVASPGFIAFYKLTMMRDTNGKQDTSDINRLRRLGLLRDPYSKEMMRLLCDGVPADAGDLLDEMY